MRQHGHFRHSKVLQASTSKDKDNITDESRKPGNSGISKATPTSTAIIKVSFTTIKQVNLFIKTRIKIEQPKILLKVESKHITEVTHPMVTRHVRRPAQSNATTSNLPGPHGEGPYPYPPHTYIPNSAELAPASECMMSCCAGCKPTDMYCCNDPHCKYIQFFAMVVVQAID